jgi:class 3 adenylate cyclase/tetratricopeptide (TPR) repeat protein
VAYERRIVTVLFADLVGFTPLTEALDPEDVAAIQDRYFAAARETVDRHGGVVEKFIGDAVSAAFGVPVGRDDDPERAVLAGLAIAAGVERLNAELGLPEGTLAIRVGIATGEVAHATSGPERGRLTGDMVNTAARLQTAAPPGRVLVDQATALAIAEAVELEPAFEVSLKGKANPVRVHIVGQVRANRSRETVLADLHAPTLGRETELALLAAAARRADAGATETWLVVAPPGTGKTRLLDELQLRLTAAGWGGRLHRARMRSRDARPFGALSDLAASVVGRRSLADLEQELRDGGVPAGRAQVVASAILDLAGPDAGAGGSGSRDERFEAWLTAFDRLGGSAAVGWLVEDLHWAGPDTLAFLELARATPSVAGRLLVTTARPAFLERRPEWAVDAPLEGRRMFELATLPPAATSDLIAALVGGDVLPRAVVDRIAAASDGNCLFVEELLRLWISAGLLVRTEARWTLTREASAIVVPTTVQAVYGAQLDELPADARRVVREGAVSGRRVADGWLDQLGLDHLRRALESVRARRLFDGPASDPLFGSAYLYRHALLRDAAYASLGRSDRSSLHVRFAAWLQAASTDPDVIAELVGEHLTAALDEAPALAASGPGLDREGTSRDAARWLERAAERAVRAGARDHAVELFDRATGRTPATPGDAVDLARRERRLGEATADAGSMSEGVARLRSAADRYRLVLRSPTAPAMRRDARSGLATTGNALARLLHEQLLFEESAATAEAMLAEIGAADDLESAWLRLRAATARNMFSDDPADLAPTAAAVIPIAERAGDRQLALEARLALLAVSETIDPEFRVNADALAVLAQELRRPDVESRVHRLRALAAIEAGEDPGPLLDDAAAVAISHGLDEALGWSHYLRAELAFQTGDWDRALASGREAIAIAERHAYLRVAVRSWFVVVPIASVRSDEVLLRHAERWFTENAANFPDSPYGRFMHTAIDVHLRAHGLGTAPDLDPDRLLPSFVVDPSASWLEAADTVLRRWLADGRHAAVDLALRRMRETYVGVVTPFADAAIGVMEARRPGTTVADLHRAQERARAAAGPWWLAKAIRLLEGRAAASPEAIAEAAATERRLGVTTPPP